MKKVLAGLLGLVLAAVIGAVTYAADFSSQIPAAPNLDYFMSKVGPLFSASGVGYSSGNGGAVTQITSRTTGVTLNNLTGQITMFSAAGSATAATFTVTDSQVALHDTIVLNTQAATNLYELFVTAVAAGSFNVTFLTTGGTSTDAPIINFAVIKGQSS